MRKGKAMENSYSIEELIEQLEDLLNKATRVPFNKKGMVDLDTINEVVQDMRMVLPMEIQQAQKVVMDKNNIINSAKQEAENIIRKAEKQREEMLNESDLIKEARARATEIMGAAQNHCADLRGSTNDYVEKMLKRVMDLMATDLKELDVLCSSINNAAQGSTQPKPRLQPLDNEEE